jgi:hypothetical protein
MVRKADVILSKNTRHALDMRDFWFQFRQGAGLGLGG